MRKREIHKKRWSGETGLILLSLICLQSFCVSGSLGALDNDVETNALVTASEDAFPLTIPPVPDGSEPARIQVTVDAAPGWRIVRQNPTPGWVARYVFYYTGDSPGQAYDAEFTGRVVRDPPLPSAGSGGTGGQPDNYTVNAKGTSIEPEYYILPPRNTVCVGEGAAFTAFSNDNDPDPAEEEVSSWKIDGVAQPGTASSTNFVYDVAKVYTVEAKSSATPVLSDTTRMTVVNVEILEPDGLPVQEGEGHTYFRSNPSCFEWQYVHVDNEVESYHASQPIEGIVEPIPQVSYYWHVNKGTLENRTTESPSYVPNNQTVPETMRQVTLSLAALEGYPSSRYGRRERTLEVYRDHLERDYQNFGSGIPCGGEGTTNQQYSFVWSFNKYGATWLMPHSWNCYGSVWHAYDGTHDGYSEVIPNTGFSTSTPYDDPIPWSTALSGLKRGDIVSFYYYDAQTDTETMEHAHTCLGDASEMYGANNEPIYAVYTRYDAAGNPFWWKGGSWKWWVASSQEYYDGVNACMLNNKLLVNRIRVHRKK